jgi:hypothetical protein
VVNVLIQKVRVDRKRLLNTNDRGNVVLMETVVWRRRGRMRRVASRTRNPLQNLCQPWYYMRRRASKEGGDDNAMMMTKQVRRGVMWDRDDRILDTADDAPGQEK